jgi:hypothetical protein
MLIKDGGYAFPQVDPIKNDIHNKYGTDRGMTLRDHFAGLAMQGLLARKPMSGAEQAHEAYKIADAMLKARVSE